MKIEHVKQMLYHWATAPTVLEDLTDSQMSHFKEYSRLQWEREDAENES